ncbi:MAG: hypothetical protein V2A58_00965 [Planctomycetota bacterium]
MPPQHDQFIDWFLPEEDSIEDSLYPDATTATLIRPVCAHAASVGVRSRVRPFIFWLLSASGALGMLSALLSSRLELIPLWGAFTVLSCLVLVALREKDGAALPSPAPSHAGSHDRPTACPSCPDPPSLSLVDFEPMVRQDAPPEGSEPLSAVLIEDGASSGYRGVWVVVTLRVSNRAGHPFTFHCERIRLRSPLATVDLDPVDLADWRVAPGEVARLSTLAHMWTDRPPRPSDDLSLSLCLSCPTTGSPFEIALCPRVWTLPLRPAFFDEGSIRLVPRPTRSRPGLPVLA